MGIEASAWSSRTAMMRALRSMARRVSQAQAFVVVGDDEDGHRRVVGRDDGPVAHLAEVAVLSSSSLMPM